MANPIEAAHQTIKAVSGVAATAQSAGIPLNRMVAILKGQTTMSGPEAAKIAGATGQTVHALLSVDEDVQACTNRNSLP
jgi:hypothetical protein